MIIRQLIFAIVTAIAAFLIYVYPVNILTYLLFDTKLVEPAAIGASFVLAGLLFFYLRTHSTSAILRHLTHYGMGMGFIALMVGHLGLLACVFLPELRHDIGLVCVVLTGALIVIALWQGRHVIVKRLDIRSDKIDEVHKLVFISDVHLGSNSSGHLRALCQKIEALDYEALLIGGDLFDSSAFKTQDLAPIGMISKPIFYVTGNHEYYVKDHLEKLSHIKEHNITWLDNEAALFQAIQIIGVSDAQCAASQRQIAQGFIKADLFNLLLVHQPAIWDDVPENTDFMISGHTHNGQIMPFNWLVRLQFKAVYGLYQKAATKLYVSSGAGTWGPAMRLGTHNEIIHITIAPSGPETKT
ncbi:MAG: metallophosphoesterase [Candidatus Puniceispirillaceae bacterium]